MHVDWTGLAREKHVCLYCHCCHGSLFPSPVINQGLQIFDLGMHLRERFLLLWACRRREVGSGKLKCNRRETWKMKKKNVCVCEVRRSVLNVARRAARVEAKSCWS